VVHLVSRFELNMAFVDVVIRNLPYLISKSQGSDQCLAYIQGIVTGLFHRLLKHDSKQIAIPLIGVKERCRDTLQFRLQVLVSGFRNQWFSLAHPFKVNFVIFTHLK